MILYNSKLDNLGVGIAVKGVDFSKTIPKFSEESSSIPFDNFHSKQCNKEANTCISILSPKASPAQIHLPAPNGR